MNSGMSGLSGLSGLVGGGASGGCTPSVDRSRLFTKANNERFQIAHDASLSFGDTAWCAHFWVYLESVSGTDYYTGFSKDDNNGAGTREYACLVRNADNLNRVTFGVFDGTSAVAVAESSTFGAIPLQTWTLVKVRHDPVANIVGIKVNNGVEDTVATSGPAGNGTASFYIGGEHLGNPILALDGRIQQLLLFASNTSADDDAAIYAAGAGGDYRNLSLSVAPSHAWPFNELSGDAVATVGGIDLTDTNTVTSATGAFLTCP